MTLPAYCQPKLFIANQFIPSLAAQHFQVHNPYDGTLIALVQSAGAGDYDVAVTQAAQAFAAHAHDGAAVRSLWLLRWAECIEREAQTLATIMTAESGKPIAESKTEIAYALGYLRWYAAECIRAQGEMLPQTDVHKWMYAITAPIGLVATITPWNFPLAMALRKWAPALAAGNAVVAKPATETPLTLLALAGLYAESGAPEGLLNVLPTAQYKEMGEWMCYDERIGKLSFTGSTATGALLMRQSADTVKRLSLELGGNAAAIVCADAQIEKAVQGVMQAKFRNGGQSCVAANRILVARPVAETFTALLQQAIEALVQANPTAPHTQVGTVIHERAIQRLETLVAQAVSQGANLVCGGGRLAPDSLQFVPTLLTQCTPQMHLYAEEIFGPVAAVYVFDTHEQALAMANDTRYGLAGYLFTENTAQQAWYRSRLQVGILGINTGLVSHAEVPFGGMKQSGFGKEGGRAGLAEYQVLRYVAQAL